MPDIVPLTSLWLPIVVSAIAVFFASFLAWMVLPHHKKDYGTIPNEDEVMAAIRDAGVQPGQYALPSCGGDMKKMNDPEFLKKMGAGPCALLLVGPNGPPRMGKALGTWFVYTLAISTFVAYLASRYVPNEHEYLHVFRIVGTTAFLAYSAAVVPNAIWKNGSWSGVIKDVLDGLVYALLTAGIFAAFWPGG